MPRGWKINLATASLKTLYDKREEMLNKIASRKKDIEGHTEQEIRDKVKYYEQQLENQEYKRAKAWYDLKKERKEQSFLGFIFQTGDYKRSREIEKKCEEIMRTDSTVREKIKEEKSNWDYLADVLDMLDGNISFLNRINTYIMRKENALQKKKNCKVVLLSLTKQYVQ